VRPSVVVLKNFPAGVHCGKHVWCQNLISLSSGAKRVRNRLRENNLRARRPYLGAVLRRRCRLARARWYSRIKDWDLQNWSLFLYLKWCLKFEVNYIFSHVAFLLWESIFLATYLYWWCNLIFIFIRNVMETNNYAQNNSWKCGILKQININLIVFNNCYVYVIYLMCYCIKINNILLFNNSWGFNSEVTCRTFDQSYEAFQMKSTYNVIT
jgi:hypothetical protein